MVPDRWRCSNDKIYSFLDTPIKSSRVQTLERETPSQYSTSHTVSTCCCHVKAHHSTWKRRSISTVRHSWDILLIIKPNKIVFYRTFVCSSHTMQQLCLLPYWANRIGVPGIEMPKKRMIFEMTGSGDLITLEAYHQPDPDDASAQVTDGGRWALLSQLFSSAVFFLVRNFLPTL